MTVTIIVIIIIVSVIILLLLLSWRVLIANFKFILVLKLQIVKWFIWIFIKVISVDWSLWGLILSASCLTIFSSWTFLYIMFSLFVITMLIYFLWTLTATQPWNTCCSATSCCIIIRVMLLLSLRDSLSIIIIRCETTIVIITIIIVIIIRILRRIIRLWLWLLAFSR